MNTMKNWVVLCTALILGGAYVLGKYVEKSPAPKEPMTLSVTAEESISAAPTVAELNLGVQTGRRKTAPEAMEELSTKMGSAFTAVKAKGIKEQEVSTHSLSLSPAADYDKEGKPQNQGFEAQQNLHIRVCNLKDVGDVLQAAVQAGANQAGGVRFTVENPKQLAEGAKEKATAKAQADAATLANRLGKKLGKLKGYAEHVGLPHERRLYGEGRVLADRAGGPPMPAGEQQITVSITLIYELQ